MEEEQTSPSAARKESKKGRRGKKSTEKSTEKSSEKGGEKGEKGGEKAVEMMVAYFFVRAGGRWAQACPAGTVEHAAYTTHSTNMSRSGPDSVAAVYEDACGPLPPPRPVHRLRGASIKGCDSKGCDSRGCDSRGCDSKGCGSIKQGCYCPADQSAGGHVVVEVLITDCTMINRQGAMSSWRY
jgi:hypothetical protein